ncbi:uncharacterized protein LOC111996907 isoform X2 [Quercus suber]|uniref:uncharacterized protein LOC111996907 isoform X2 n=1 Tax=Quercus suber TaxID=58331 RepID=UPI0032DE5B69
MMGNIIGSPLLGLVGGEERIRASKDLTEAKRMVESKERQRYLALKKKEKEEEKRAREKILKKLEHDKVERRSGIGLPPESPSVKPSTYLLQEKAGRVILMLFFLLLVVDIIACEV